ncbi:MAG: cupin domain-containing protein [Chloroflexi bacterium]|nr:cupin domain-containing protein [Chloroflexota bacterium]
MAELFSGRAGGAQRVTLRVVEIPRLRPPDRRHPHEHRDVEECIYVLAGRGRVWIGGEIAAVQAGDAVLVPAGTPHATLNIADEPLRLACFFPTADMPASLIEHTHMEIPDEVLYGES